MLADGEAGAGVGRGPSAVTATAEAHINPLARLTTSHPHLTVVAWCSLAKSEGSHALGTGARAGGIAGQAGSEQAYDQVCLRRSHPTRPSTGERRCTSSALADWMSEP